MLGAIGNGTYWKLGLACPPAPAPALTLEGQREGSSAGGDSWSAVS